MIWQIHWSMRGIRDLKKLDEPIKKKILDSLDNLVQQPKSADIKKLEVKPDEYRLRIGDWRVRFRVDFTNKTYLITHVKHRKNVYK